MNKMIGNLWKRWVAPIILIFGGSGTLLAAGAGELIPGFSKLDSAARMAEIETLISAPGTQGTKGARKAMLREVIQLCQENQFLPGEALAYNTLFELHRMPHDGDSLKLMHERILKDYYRHLGCAARLKFALHTASYYGESSRHDLAQEAYHKALLLGDSCNLPAARAYGGLAVVSNWLGQNEEAIRYLTLEIGELRKDSATTDAALAKSYVNLSSVFSQVEKEDSALVYANAALDLVRNPRGLVHRARLHMKGERYEAAEKDHDEAAKMIKENPAFFRDEPALLVGQAHAYRMMGKFDAAIAAAERSVELASQGTRLEAIAYGYGLLVSAHMGDKANLADSMGIYMERLNNERLQQTAMQERARFDAMKKEKEILELNGQLKDQQIETLQVRSYLLYGGIAALFLVSLLYWRYRRGQARTVEEMERLRKQAIKLQMNPHFIFNVLNSINSFIAENDQKSARYFLAKFAKLMRLTLENSQEDTISIENEIEFLQNYLLLEQMRMQNFDFEFEVAEELKELKIPGLLIQPLVENSLLHGFSGISYRGMLRIGIIREGNSLLVEVVDNGVGKEKSQQAQAKIEGGHRSFALSILHKRLASYSQQAVDVVYAAGLRMGDNVGTKVSFRFPIIQ